MQFDVVVSWDDQERAERFSMEVMAGETQNFNSFSSHNFIISKREVRRKGSFELYTIA